MINLLGLWVGNSFGTHPCNIFAEFSNQGTQVSVTIRAASTGASDVVVFTGNFTQTDGPISVICNEAKDGHFTSLSGSVNLNVISEHKLEGSFELNNEAKGVIQLSRFISMSAGSGASEPPQIIAKEYLLLDPLKICKKDVKKIIEMMKENAGSLGKVAVTERKKNMRVSKYADEYLASVDSVEEIDSLLINSQTQMPGFVNTMTVILNSSEPSKIISQSAGLAGFHSGSLVIKEYLERQSSKFFGYLKKYGLEINGLLFLILLAILPSFSFLMRSVSIMAFVIFALVYRMGYRWISKTIIQPGLEQHLPISQRFPKLAWLFLTLGSAILSGLIGWGLKWGLDYVLQ